MRKFISTLLTALLLFAAITTYHTAVAQESSVDVSSMMATVEALSQNPRGYENQEIELARQFIIDKFTDYHLEVTTQEFETSFVDGSGNPFTAVNIIGTLKPNTEDQTDDILIIGAHYDGINNIPAANDNASGMAVMLELARLLHDVPTDTEIRFVAFDMEEQGLVGSMHYVNNAGDDLDNIIGILNFDMLAAKKEATVKIYSATGSENYLSDILKQNENYAEIEVLEYYNGTSDHASFHPKAIPNLFFSHPSVSGEYHVANDIIEHISPDMLAYAADAGQTIALEMMSEKTPSYLSIAKPAPDDTVYKIENNIRIPTYGKIDEFEQTLNIKFSQIPSEDNDAVYQAKVNMFDMPQTMTLSVLESGSQGVTKRCSVDMQGAGIPFEELREILNNQFGEPTEQTFDSMDTVSYKWHNIFGNTYQIESDRPNGSYSFYIEHYQGGAAEGYTIKDDNLIRMETEAGGDVVQITKIDGETIRKDIINKPSDTLPITEHAKQAWDKIKRYLSDEERSNIGFIIINSDGIGGAYPISMSQADETDAAEFEDKISETIEKLQDNSSYGISNEIAGIHLTLDYIDLLNPQGSSYEDEDLSKNIAIARASCQNGSNVPSIWAVDGVVQAIEAEVLPDELQTNYQDKITREQFCDLAFKLLGEITGLKAHLDSKAPFQDTDHISVGTLYRQGIINGKAEGIFAPHDSITREEAATILDRICQYIGIPDYDYHSFRFNDDEMISEWAKNGVYNMQFIGVMNGTGDNLFTPQDTYTVEQAILTMVRIYDLNNI